MAELALANLSNAEIAERRGTSPRTVANQVASLFRKLGVASRSELRALVASGELEPAARQARSPGARRAGRVGRAKP